MKNINSISNIKVLEIAQDTLRGHCHSLEKGNPDNIFLDSRFRGDDKMLQAVSFNSSNNGFTLIETLVAITIFAILGAIVSASLFSLLRGATRTESIKEVKQNGEFALNNMEVKLRNSVIQNSNCTGSTNKSLTFTDIEGANVIYSCDLNNGVKRIRQQVAPPTGPTVTNYLTGTGVELTGGGCGGAVDLAFTCTTDAATLQKTVEVDFSLQEKGNPKSKQQFKMTVGLRNK